MENIQIITASAGSGKTTRVIDLLIRYLLGTEEANPYDPSGMIVTTFTRAAAGELRDRARKQILEEGSTELAGRLDQAMIGTVNSVCGRLLELFAFESGISPVTRVITNEEKEIVFQSTLSSVLGGETAGKMARYEEIFKMNSQEIRKLISKIVDLIRINQLNRKNYTGEDLIEKSISHSVDSLLELFERTKKSEFRSLIEWLSKEIPEAIRKSEEASDTTAATRSYANKLNDLLYKIRNLDLGSLSEHTLAWNDLGSLCETKLGKVSTETGIFNDLFMKLSGHISTDEFQADMSNFIISVFTAAREALACFQDIKKERGLIDFVDQETILLSTLDNDGVRQNFRERFRVLIVDEFQDTSPLQLALFLKIAELVETVYWVGDPKQAIYGFRGTDASLLGKVLSSNRSPARPETKPLSVSFRSRSSLVTLVNNIFPAAFQVDENNEQFLAPEEVKLTADRNDEYPGAKTAFQIWASYYTGSGTYYPFIQNGHLALRVKDFKENQEIWIIDNVSGRREMIRYGDIAVHCRTNSSCAAVAKAFREEGIPVTVAAAGLHATAEFRLVAACMNYFDNPTDNMSLAEIGYLTSPGHNMQELLTNRLEFLEGKKNNLVGQDWIPAQTIAIRGCIDNLRNSLSLCTVSAVAVTLTAETGIRELAKGWGERDQRMANLEKSLAYISEYETYATRLGYIPSWPGFQEWFSAMVELEEDNCGIAHSNDAVNILTYHKAKGLEWPVVIMHDMDYNRETDVFSVKTWQETPMEITDPLSGRLIHYWPWPYQRAFGKRSGYKGLDELADATPVHDIQERRERLEKIRLLYVGMTRARDYLILPFAFNVKKAKKGESGVDLDLSPKAFLSVIMPEGIRGFIPEFPNQGDEMNPLHPALGGPVEKCRYWGLEYDAPASGTAGSDEQVTVSDIPLFHGEKKPYWRNPSKEPELKDCRTLSYLEVHPRLEITHTENEEEGAFGTCIHRMLCAFQERMSDAELLDISTRFLNDCGFEDTVNPAHLISSAKSFKAWLDTNYPGASQHKEYLLMMEKDEQMVNGIADLVVETMDKVILVDYKTFPGSPDPKKNRESCEWKAKTYGGQLALYKEMLEKARPGKTVETWIWFVIAGTVVEVTGKHETK